MPTLRSAPSFGGGATVRPDTAGVPDLTVSALANSEGVLVGVENGGLKTTEAASTPQHATAAANTAVTQTFAAVVGKSHRLTSLAVSYSAAPTGGRVTVSDGGTVVFEVDVTAAGPVSVPLPGGGLQGTANTAMTVTLAAGGAAVIGKVNTGRITA